jgi:hypothetical protein
MTPVLLIASTPWSSEATKLTCSKPPAASYIEDGGTDQAAPERWAEGDLADVSSTVPSLKRSRRR